MHEQKSDPRREGRESGQERRRRREEMKREGRANCQKAESSCQQIQNTDVRRMEKRWAS